MKFYVRVKYIRGETAEERARSGEEEALTGRRAEKLRERERERGEGNKIKKKNRDSKKMRGMERCRVRKGKRKRETDNKTAVNESQPAVQTD